MNETQAGVFWPKDRAVDTADGARIAYTFLGPPPAPHAPVVALLSGFLCPDTWWWHLAPALARSGHTVLLFHYRGVGESTPPAPLQRQAFAVPRFAADLGDIADAERLDRLVLVGHSMGVQVMFEAYRQLRPRVDGLVAITGTPASPLRSVYGRDRVGLLLYEPLRLLLRALPPPLARSAWRGVWGNAGLLRLGRLLGAFGDRTDAGVVGSYLRHGARIDPRVALLTAEAMHAHTAEDVLPDVTVPALVVVGGKDPFAPAAVGEAMAARMPAAELRRVAGGTHGTLLEYPEQVGGWVLDFLERVGQT